MKVIKHNTFVLQQKVSTFSYNKLDIKSLTYEVKEELLDKIGVEVSLS